MGVRTLGPLRRRWQRLVAGVDVLEADELRADSGRLGARSIAGLADREIATVTGALRSTTVAPPGTTLALKAELYDGTQKLELIWLGRRTIAGIHPGTYLRVHGRVCHRAGVPTIYNPRYEILPNRGR